MGADHHLQRLGVVHDRTQRLTELMGNRAASAPTSSSPIGIGSEREVPSAILFGPLPCAALVQESGNQERSA